MAKWIIPQERDSIMPVLQAGIVFNGYFYNKNIIFLQPLGKVGDYFFFGILHNRDYGNCIANLIKIDQSKIRNFQEKSNWMATCR